MNGNTDNYCLILAGGKGRRLWPCSREARPKQFLDFFSTGRTLLQQTYDRMSAFIPSGNIYVSTNRIYTSLVEEQLPELPKENILSEPIFRNTAPSLAWAAYRILHINRKARLVVVPSDQAVFKEDEFRRNVVEGLDFVDGNDCILTMGVKPTRPEPGYGYIQQGTPTRNADVFKVKSFTEKPDRDFARMFMDSGEFYWNTGLFLANVGYLGLVLAKILPPVMRRVPNWDGGEYDLDKDMELVKENFPSFPNMSIEYGVLEGNKNVYVMKCDFGWADLGMWHSIYESMSQGDGDNVVIGSHVVTEDSHNNIIKMPDDHLAVVNGLDGYIVAEEGNVLLICKKEDSSALVRKYANDVQVNYGEEFI